MAKYHVNEKGEAGICRAQKNCPFGDLETEHYSSLEEARASYERKMAEGTFSQADATSVSVSSPREKEEIRGIIKQLLNADYGLEIKANLQLQIDNVHKKITIVLPESAPDEANSITLDQLKEREIPTTEEDYAAAQEAVLRMKLRKNDAYDLAVDAIRKVRHIDAPELYSELAELAVEKSRVRVSDHVKATAKKSMQQALVNVYQLDKALKLQEVAERADREMEKANQDARASVDPGQTEKSFAEAATFTKYYGEYQLKDGERDFDNVYLRDGSIAGLGESVVPKTRLLSSADPHTVRRIVELSDNSSIVWIENNESGFIKAVAPTELRRA